MSIEKFFALYFPLKTRSICTVKTAKWVSFISFIIYAGYNCYAFFVHGKIKYGDGYICVPVGISSQDNNIIQKVRAAVYSFGPFAIMGLTNIAIIYKFMGAKFQNGGVGSTSTESTNQALSKSATRGTAMLITVSVAFILLTSPIVVFAAVPYDNRQYPIVFSCFVLLRYVNHSINGVLYCITGSTFRQELILLLSCNCVTRKRKTDSPNTRSNTTNVTEFSGDRGTDNTF